MSRSRQRFLDILRENWPVICPRSMVLVRFRSFLSQRRGKTQGLGEQVYPETCIAGGDAADGLCQVLIAQGTIQPEALRHPHRLDPQQFAAGCDGGGKGLVQRNIALQNKTQHYRGIDKGN